MNNLRLFAHRGFVTGDILQNSLASFEEAQKNGFKAIEFDIWFLAGKLFLKHDLPQENELEKLANFSDYLERGNDFFYWLDFKNLDEENALNALKLVKKNIEDAGINQDQIYFAPFITDYKIATKIFEKIRIVFGLQANLVAVCQELINVEDERILYQFLSQNKIKFLSIFHQLLNEKFLKNFSDIEIFAWTVNDLSRLKELEKLGIKNFATDKITPQNYETQN